jgi:hypothetical protein
MDNDTLASFIDRYIARRYHRGPMHISQLQMLRGINMQLRRGLVIDESVERVKLVVQDSPESPVGIFGKMFLDRVERY